MNLYSGVVNHRTTILSFGLHPLKKKKDATKMETHQFLSILRDGGAFKRYYKDLQRLHSDQKPKTWPLFSIRSITTNINICFQPLTFKSQEYLFFSGTVNT